MNLRETYNKIAEEWSQDHGSDTWWISGTDTFISFLKAGDTVLDVGCGAGTKSKYLTEKGLEVLGIDFSEKMIELAAKSVPRAKFMVLDMKESDALNKTFDGIFMQASLLHIPKKEAPDIIRNIAEHSLKSGGYFYVAVKEIKPGRPEEEIKVENDYSYPYERFFSYFTTAEIKNFFQQSNLEIVYENITPAGKTNWIQIIGRKR
jgi:cyclopropane fatty-acyl-phospholipid synthase-like methyltransferase